MVDPNKPKAPESDPHSSDDDYVNGGKRGMPTWLTILLIILAVIVGIPFLLFLACLVLVASPGFRF